MMMKLAPALFLALLVSACGDRERKLADVPPAIDAKTREVLIRTLEGSIHTFSHIAAPIGEAKIAKPFQQRNVLTGREEIIYCAMVVTSSFPVNFSATATATIEIDASGQPSPNATVVVSRHGAPVCSFQDAMPLPELIALRQERIKKAAAAMPAPTEPSGR